MEKIKIKRRINSSTIRINELKNFINKDVEITITPIGELNELHNNKERLLKLSIWNVTEEDVRIKDWPLEKY